jgi:transmembrane sensor
VAGVWGLTGEHREIREQGPVPSARDILAGEASSAIPPSRGRQAGRWPLRVAALAAALLLGLGMGHFSARPGGMGVEFHTGAGEMTTATLADGTVVRLAPTSRLRIEQRRGVREVWLEGRAFFSVARDPNRPFIVRGPAGDATVLGTRFDVENRGGDLRLLVLEGRVAVSVPDGNVEVGAGELAEARRGSAPSVTEVADPEAMVAWLGVFMAFESTPLGQVARELEARLGIQVELTDPELAARTVSGWFGQDVRDEIVPIICRIAGVRCEVEGSAVRMSP